MEENDKVLLYKKSGPPRSVLSIDVAVATLAMCILTTENPKKVRKNDPLPLDEFVVAHRETFNLGGEKTPLRTFADKVVHHFDQRPHFLEVDRVRIEQQPLYPGRRAYSCFRNQALSMILYTYFISKGHQNVQFVHAVYKLQVLGPSFADGSGIVGQKNYGNRKDLAVTHVAVALKPNNIKDMKELLASDKPDDEADSILQGLHCLYRET